MQATRRARIESTIREELSVFIPAEVEDPRVSSINVTSVKLAEDASHAEVFITMDAEEGEAPEKRAKRLDECMKGLTQASGFMRKHLGFVLQLRHTPTLSFREDKGYENAERVQQLLRQIAQESSGSPDSTDR